MDGIDLEETNRLRALLGMPVIQAPGAASNGLEFKTAKKGHDSSDEEPASTYDSRQAKAGENYQRLQDEAAAKAKRQQRKEATRKAKDQAARFTKLEGKGLGDAGDDELDTKAWLLQQKKRQKKIEKARKLEEELAAREREQQAEYTAADLAGVHVGHEINQFEDEEEQVLVLKDAAVDDDSAEDELENVHLRDQERINEVLESKKRKTTYNPNDNEDGQQSILAQYDEEIDGKRGKRFKLDGQGSSKTHADKIAASENQSKSLGVQISLDLLKDAAPVSDYKEATEVKIRKPKKSKNKAKSNKRRRLDDDDEEKAVMDVDNSTSNQDLNFDDEDLHGELAIQRRAALKKRKKDPNRFLENEVDGEADAMDVVIGEDEEGSGLVIDETSEFVANLQRPLTPERRPVRSTQATKPTQPADSDEEETENGDVPMREANEDYDVQDTINNGEGDEHQLTATGLDDETTLDRGMGAALSMLRQRGLVKMSEDGDANANFRNRQRFLAEKHKQEEEAERRARAQRERDRQSGKLDRMSVREREEYARQNNAAREQADSRKMAELFNKEYKPNVEIKHVDAFGRRVGQKEAFKEMSHQFHGKGSGKQKTQKKIDRVAKEQKEESMSTLDSSQHTNMNSAMGATSRKRGQAGVRLQ